MSFGSSITLGNRQHRRSRPVIPHFPELTPPSPSPATSPTLVKLEAVVTYRFIADSNVASSPDSYIITSPALMNIYLGGPSSKTMHGSVSGVYLRRPYRYTSLAVPCVPHGVILYLSQCPNALYMRLQVEGENTKHRRKKEELSDWNPEAWNQSLGGLWGTKSIIDKQSPVELRHLFYRT